MLQEFLEKLGDVCVVEKKPSMEGRMMIMVLGPKPAK